MQRDPDLEIHAQSLEILTTNTYRVETLTSKS